MEKQAIKFEGTLKKDTTTQWHLGGSEVVKGTIWEQEIGGSGHKDSSGWRQGETSVREKKAER